MNQESTDSALILRIGDEDIDDVSGVQTYQIEYTVDGLLNPANAQHSGDELYWNVIGAGWEIPLGDITVAVTGPAAVEGAVVLRRTVRLDHAVHVRDVHRRRPRRFTQDLVPVGAQLSTVTGWPARARSPASSRSSSTSPTRWPPSGPSRVFGILGLLVLVGGGDPRVRPGAPRRPRQGLPRPDPGPASRPTTSPAVPRSGFRDKRGAVSVQFQPPEGVRPGEVGTLVDEKADPVDVTATLVDLAVRGWLRIEEVPRSNPKKKAKDWTLVQLKNKDGSLLPYEDELLASIFASSTSVKLSDLKTTFAASMAKVQDGLYDHVTESGWFRANPKSVRTAWHAAGIVLVVARRHPRRSSRSPPVLSVAGHRAGAHRASRSSASVVTILGNAAPARTDDGTAVLAQSLGFRRYLATAEANQLRFEEGEDIFSRYLPYAIVFGLADRWARVFSELAAQGRAFEQPGWYVGGYYPGANIYWATAFASSLDRFAAVATESISAPTPGTSGGSGFSGAGSPAGASAAVVAGAGKTGVHDAAGDAARGPHALQVSRQDPAGKLYEPKWDGFRAIVFRDGDSVEIGSRNTKPMQRYFPEIVDGGPAVPA